MNIYRPLLKGPICDGLLYLPRSSVRPPKLRRHNLQVWQRSFRCGLHRQNASPSENLSTDDAGKGLGKGPETSESKLFALGSSIATRLSVDRTLQCTEFDDKGDIVAGNVEIKKSDLVTKVSFALMMHFYRTKLRN